MKMTIGIPVMNQEEETVRTLKQLFETAVPAETEFILIDNGSTIPLSETLQKNFSPETLTLFKIIVHRNEENVGVRPALNQIWQEATGEIIVYTHNDVEFYDKEWQVKVKSAFDQNPEAGIVGAYGAKGIGTDDIYTVPYAMQQLARLANVSNARMDQAVHGFRNIYGDKENVAVFDGFFMAIKKELLDKVKGFSDILPQHHNYDNLICIQSLENGYENIVIPLDIEHLGGRTDTREEWNKNMGKEKADIHADAHPPLYEYCRELLPIRVINIFGPENKVVGYELVMANKVVKTKRYGN